MEILQNEFTSTTLKFNQDIESIIQAFINFYGDQHKEYILDVFNNPRIIWYSNKENKNIHDAIISSIPIDELNNLLKKRNETAFTQSSYIDELNILVLPLSYDLTHIIHEFNHKVASHIVSFKPLFQINGLSISKEENNGVIIYNEFLNEAINQKITLDILNELNNIGVQVEKTPSWQENIFPLINLFYETFKDLLKETYTSGNISNFINLVGEDKYNYFCEIIYLKSHKAMRNLRRYNNPNISNEDIEIIEEIVNEMKEHYDNTTIINDKNK